MHEMEGAPRASRHPAGSDHSGAMALRNPVTASAIRANTGCPMPAGSRSFLRSRSPVVVT